MDLRQIFTGLKTAFKGKGRSDELDTVVRSWISKFIKSFVQEMGGKFEGISKHTATMIGTASVIFGWALRKVTNFGTLGDNVITDIAQEIADQFSEIADKTKDTPEKMADKKKLMTSIAKLFINAQLRFARDIDIEDFFAEFNILMSRMNEKSQMAFVDMLSKFNNKQMAEFMRMTTETKELYFGHFFAKDKAPSVDKKSLTDWIKETKKNVFSGTEMVIETIGSAAKKFDEQFKDGSELREAGKKFKNFAQNF